MALCSFVVDFGSSQMVTCRTHPATLYSHRVKRSWTTGVRVAPFSKDGPTVAAPPLLHQETRLKVWEPLGVALPDKGLDPSESRAWPTSLR